MNLKPRHIVYISLLAIGAWVIYLGWSVLTPFVFAALFAYLLNPLVTFLSVRKIPRAASILFVYVGIVAALFAAIYFLGGQLVIETKEFAKDAQIILSQAQNGKSGFPEWANPYIAELSQSLRDSINISSQELVHFFSGAVNSVLAFLVFVLVLFYFLKDGKKFFESAEDLLPGKAKVEFTIVAQKVNAVLGNYLRAQAMMVIFMATLISIVLSVFGVRYALILGIIAGLAEILPYAGPAFAFASIFTVVSLTGGASLLHMSSALDEGFIVAVIYVLINQSQNILIAPQVTARMVRLHPLLVLASVLVGGHLFGLTGVLFAVPVVASFKVIMEHILDLLK